VTGTLDASGAGGSRNEGIGGVFETLATFGGFGLTAKLWTTCWMRTRLDIDKSGLLVVFEQ
jgi:hypothetical protein